MTYLKPTRLYRDPETGITSPLLHECIGDKVTIKRSFSCDNRQGTWRGSPFVEVETLPPPPQEYVASDSNTSLDDIYDTICESITHSWDADKFHVIFMSSGYDSRILAGAIKRLVEVYGENWLGQGLLFLSNRWEADEARGIIEAQGWTSKNFQAFDYNADQFYSSLFFSNHWRQCNPPVPLPGNLWWYLVDWYQMFGIILKDDNRLQGYSGYYANETWRCFARGGFQDWTKCYTNWYYYNVMAALPCKIPDMHYPLTDTDVLRLIPSGNGDKLRKQVSEFACPEAIDIPNVMLDDRHHPISKNLQEYCNHAYRGSWYGENVRKNWICPDTSDFSDDWARYGLASLCEELIRRGVELDVTD